MLKFNKKVQEKFTEICNISGKLFRVELTGQEIWDLYLNSFSNENNPIFRDPNSTSKNCNHCKNFIRRYGNIVSIDENYNITTMFDIEISDNNEFKNTISILSNIIKQSKIKEVFFETFEELNSLPYESCNKSNNIFQLGISSNIKRYTKEEADKYGVVKPNEIRTFNHLHLSINKTFIDFSDNSIESIMSIYRDSKNVFQKAMEIISIDTLKLVKDLINQGSLLDGATHLYKIEQIIPLKEEYNNLHNNQKDNYCWVKSYKFSLAKFKNELIGVLCTELSEGIELNTACQSWNKRVDPANYMKVTAPITKKQIEEAKNFVEENGYSESFNRRFATIDDIKASEILHLNIGKGDIKKVSIFDEVKSTSTRHKRSEFKEVEEVSIKKFMKDILPSCTSIEVFLLNNHKENFVSLTKSKNNESKQIFKWNNDYSWTFNGNLAGKSQLKEAVKDAGGKIDGVLRFSISWNENGKDILDFDAHAIEPDNNHIYYGNYKNYKTPMSGMLDVDMIRPAKMGVENIIWDNIDKMSDGDYNFMIKNYDRGQNIEGFKAEIEFNNEIFEYEKKGNVQGETMIATISLKDKKFSIKKDFIPQISNNKQIYNLETNQFHKVNLLCLSPNYWGVNDIGNKYYLFMLEKCKSNSPIRSFHNENLLPELAQHRKVLEVLGTTNMIESSDNQLSGLGFNATVRDELIVKLQGSHKRIIKIKF